MLPQTGINAYVRREWLNPEESLHTSYIMVHVEDSQGGRNAHGSNIVLIADCTRVVQLEFFLGNQEARDASLAKINLLIEVLSRFGAALLSQIRLIAKVEKSGNALSLVQPEKKEDD